MKKKTEHAIKVMAMSGIVLIGWAWQSAAATPDVKAKAVPDEKNAAAQPVSAVVMPFVVYSDKDAPENRFYPTEFMADKEALEFDDGCTQQVQAGATCVRVGYKATGPYGWAGVYWVNPAGSWGDKKGGYDLRPAKKLTFWARGEKGGEHIAVFRLGGAFGMNMDSDIHGVGPLSLTKEWQQYTIDVSGRNLKYISAGFGFALTKRFNPDGCVFYIDSVQYE